MSAACISSGTPQARQNPWTATTTGSGPRWAAVNACVKVAMNSRIASVLARGGHELQVSTAQKWSPAARAADHARRLRQLLDRVAEFLHRLEVDRVAYLRPVEGDHADARVHFHLEALPTSSCPSLISVLSWRSPRAVEYGRQGRGVKCTCG